MLTKNRFVILIPLALAAALPCSSAQEKPTQPPEGRRLVELSYAEDDRPPTQFGHIVYTHRLSENYSGSERDVYNWARQGSGGYDPEASGKAAKCLALFKTMVASPTLPEDPNHILSLRCLDEGVWKEKRFDIDALPPEFPGFLSAMGYPGLDFPTSRAYQEREAARRAREIRFLLIDQTRNGTLDYDHRQEFTITCPPPGKDYHLEFQTGYLIRGVQQDSFQFTTEQYSTDLSEAAVTALRDDLRRLPVTGLKLQSPGSAPGSAGFIEIDGERRDLPASPDDHARKIRLGTLNRFLTRYAPREKRGIYQRTIEGETIKAAAVDIAALLKDPKHYEGKRIRLSGYYGGRGSGRYFAATRNDAEGFPHGPMIWLGESSSFASLENSSRPIQTMLTVEGTFTTRENHGETQGSLERLTLVQPMAAGD